MNECKWTFLLDGLICVFLSTIPFQATAQIPQSMNESTNTRWGGNNFVVGSLFFPNGERVNLRLPIRLRSPLKGDVISSTDDMGRFIFSGLSEGYYFIQIDTEKEYESVNYPVDVVQSRSPVPQTYTLSIRLMDKKEFKAKPKVISVENAGIPKSAKTHYERAIALSKDKDFNGAVEQLKAAITDHPEFVDAYNELGVQYQRLGDLAKADESLIAALKIKPDAFEPQLNRGIVLFRMNRFTESEVALRLVLKARSQSATGHFYLGRTLAKLKKYDEAETELNAAISLAPDEMKEVHRILAMLFIDKDDRQKAIDALESYFRLVPAPPDAAQLKLALAQLKEGVGRP